jgi:hypothetical protein
VWSVGIIAGSWEAKPRTLIGWSEFFDVVAKSDKENGVVIGNGSNTSTTSNEVRTAPRTQRQLPGNDNRLQRY